MVRSWYKFAASLFALTVPWLGAAQSLRPPDPACPITQPNGQPPPVQGISSPNGHGNGDLWTSLSPDGRIVFQPGGPGLVLEDGALKIQWGWWRRSFDGQLTIEGRRIDGVAPPLRYEQGAPAEGPVEFSSTYLIFPTPGCWLITGHIGNGSLRFIIRVVKIGE